MDNTYTIRFFSKSGEIKTWDYSDRLAAKTDFERMGNMTVHEVERLIGKTDERIKKVVLANGIILGEIVFNNGTGTINWTEGKYAEVR